MRLLPPADALRNLPLVSDGTLVALKELRMPIGEISMLDEKARTVEAAIQQAHALHRAWELGTINLSRSAVSDVSALAGCASLHTLDLSFCKGVRDVSALAGCVTLRSLELDGCVELTDVSALASCVKLDNLDLSGCALTNVSALEGLKALRTLYFNERPALTDVSALAGCAKLNTVSLLGSRRVTDVSALGNCPALHFLDLDGCVGLTDVSGLASCAALRHLDLRNCEGLSDVSAGGLRGIAHALPHELQRIDRRLGARGLREAARARHEGLSGSDGPVGA